MTVWKSLVEKFEIENVFINKDYEPYAKQRDQWVCSFLELLNVKVFSFKDHVIFEPGFIKKDDGSPYTVYTPFKKKWLKHYEQNKPEILPKPNFKNLFKQDYEFPLLKDLGFSPSKIKVESFNLSELDNYEITRDVPSLNSTSFLGPHLRFGTVSIRQVVKSLKKSDNVFLGE